MGIIDAYVNLIIVKRRKWKDLKKIKFLSRFLDKIKEGVIIAGYPELVGDDK